MIELLRLPVHLRSDRRHDDANLLDEKLNLRARRPNLFLAILDALPQGLLHLWYLKDMVQSLTPLRLGHVLLGQRIFLHGTLKVPHNLFEHDAVLVDPRELVPDGLDVTRVLEEVVDELLLPGHLLRDDEQAVEKVGDEILARFERQVRQQQSLVANALGPGE